MTFDEMLAMTPDELEQYRKSEIDKLIAGAPEELRPRLKGMQFTIDQRRALHKTPMGSCVELNKMMRDAVAQFNDVLHGRYEAPEPTKCTVTKIGGKDV